MLSNAAAAAGGLSPALFEKDRLVHAEGFFDLSFLDPPAPADAASPPPDVEVRSGGLKSKMLLRPTCALSKFTPPEEIAKCPRPTKYDKVVIDFSGWQVSTGKMFDSSRLERMTLRVDDLFPGWQEGMKLMSPGETRRFWIPSKLAFGDEPDGNKPAGDVVLDVSLYDIVRQEKPPDAPADVGSVPEDATVLESGLAFKVLQGGSGSKASATSRVVATYSGWQTNGKLFMSTVIGATSKFIVKDIPLKGLVEGIQLMQEGEKRRFWIPPKLALGAALVFDFELQKIE